MRFSKVELRIRLEISYETPRDERTAFAGQRRIAKIFSRISDYLFHKRILFPRKPASEELNYESRRLFSLYCLNKANETIRAFVCSWNSEIIKILSGSVHIRQV